MWEIQIMRYRPDRPGRLGEAQELITLHIDLPGGNRPSVLDERRWLALVCVVEHDALRLSVL